MNNFTLMVLLSVLAGVGLGMILVGVIWMRRERVDE